MAAALLHQPSIAPDNGESRALMDVFASLAQELEQARALSLRIEGAMCALAVEGHASATVIGDLQQFDAVIQRLGALRDFTSALSQSTPIEQRIVIGEALERITLASVRAELSGSQSDEGDGVWEML